MDNENEFEILPADELRLKYGLYAEDSPKITLDRSRIPNSLAPLIPYAEVWGISDDLMRADFAEKAGPDALDELQAAIQPFEDALDEWLAGPEASSPDPSPEYIAFSCMRMAADGI
ncbi:hypothetical protein [Lignipirellula cremea]|uniref:Uncharacterized protein n=1 Tax=Lignipirellula cremea TaxID=2528010 RepID=A0A518E004_9BACT|nr:hypothetical protein [Lignipirellula cremea]QDU97418.1 hypothetical protein Pla8534_52660 [Lignipirellula cremea]